VNRRALIALLGGAAATWPLAAGAQQAVPVVGILGPQSPGASGHLLDALRRGFSPSRSSRDQTPQHEPP
jgi:putative tryptophan/tyrosine transport system substrate-binding protein